MDKDALDKQKVDLEYDKLAETKKQCDRVIYFSRVQFFYTLGIIGASR